MPRVRKLTTPELTPEEVAAIRALLDEAFAKDEDDRFGEDDWQHALGGMHFVLDLGAEIVGHAAVVERTLEIARRPLRTGYVEAVATTPSRQRTGLGTRVMTDVGTYIRERFELGALGTGSHGFYERLGWETWRGPAFVRTSDGEQRTPDEEGYIMVLRTPTTPTLDLAAPISCDWRPGDVW